jgi:hypothetical protein
MTRAVCPREAEVLAALIDGPSHAGPSFSSSDSQTYVGPSFSSDDSQTYVGPSFSSGELAQHLTACEACAELMAARLIADAQADGVESASVPSAGQVWWRAQVRVRAEARRAAERPMHIVQAVTAACVAGALAGGTGWAWPWIRQTAAWVQGTVPADLGFAWWLAIATWLVLAPVALYFVFARE